MENYNLIVEAWKIARAINLHCQKSPVSHWFFFIFFGLSLILVDREMMEINHSTCNFEPQAHEDAFTTLDRVKLNK
jgi:hypothetical protein